MTGTGTLAQRFLLPQRRSAARDAGASPDDADDAGSQRSGQRGGRQQLTSQEFADVSVQGVLARWRGDVRVAAGGVVQVAACGHMAYSSSVSVVCGCWQRLTRLQDRVGAMEADVAAVRKSFAVFTEDVHHQMNAVLEVLRSMGTGAARREAP